MAALFDAVLKWGEKLIYQGHKDDSLPPDVLHALDDFLAESNSKLLVVLPLKDEREIENEKPARSAMMMECFDPSASPEQLVARLEVVGRHSANALYNAVRAQAHSDALRVDAAGEGTGRPGRQDASDHRRASPRPWRFIVLDARVRALSAQDGIEGSASAQGQGLHLLAGRGQDRGIQG